MPCHNSATPNQSRTAGGPSPAALRHAQRPNQTGCRSARTANDDFLSHFLRDVDLNEEVLQQFELTHAGQRDEGRGIGNNDHNFNREAVS